VRYLSLFTGVGGFDLGFDRAGMQCVLQVEQDRYCVEVLSRHWPDVPKMTDVREVKRESFYGSINLVCGGFPCQDVSVAGKRKGLAGERSGLWTEFHRIIREFTPRWVVIENVPGLFSSNGGRDFGAILRGLEECGYHVAWRVLDSRYFGVAQRRRRVFIVASIGDGGCAEILFESEGLHRNPPKSREERQGPTGESEGGTGGFSAGKSSESRGIGWKEDGTSPIRSGAIGTNQVPTITQQNQRDEVRDMGQVAGALPSQPRMKQQNYVAYYRPGSEVADTIRVGAEGKKAFNSNGTGNMVIPINTMAATRPEGCEQNRQTMGIGENGDPQFALQEGHQHAVHQVGALMGRDYKGISSDGIDKLVTLGAVRRLTPTETCRLQGFPDDWNAFQSDTQRYRQMGNAVTVDVAEWIGRRIMRVHTQSQETAS
jgi:DNA (cytosine-5)-methyltransferase 1